MPPPAIEPAEPPPNIQAITGPPGSGKSSRLAERALNLGQPALLLAISPQNRLRLEGYLGELAGDKPHAVKVCTLAGFFVECLGTAGMATSPMDDRDATWLLYSILPPEQASMALARQILEWLQPLMRSGIEPKRLLDFSESSRLHWLGELYARFSSHCEAEGSLPHAMLEARLLGLAARQPQVLPRYFQPYRAILVDEAQELPGAMLDVLGGLGLPLILAGDPRLSIRSLRGAEPDRLARIHGVENLTTCPRGNQALWPWVGRLIPEPWTPLPSEAPWPSLLRQFADVADEADALARWIARQLQIATIRMPDGSSRPAQASDFLIILRSARYRQVLRQALAQHQLPLAETVKADALETLQVSLYDLLIAFEAMNNGDIPRANQHLARWGNLHHPEATAWIDVPEASLLTAQWPDAVQADFSRLLSAYRDSQSVHQLAAQLLMGSGGSLTPWLDSLQAFEARYRSRAARPLDSATLALWLAQQGEENTLPATAGIRLQSAHQSQGEEAPFVAVPFLVAEEWPQNRLDAMLLDPEEQKSLGERLAIALGPGRPDPQEEARLLAMALTRARQGLWVSCHQKDATEAVLPSIFFDALAENPLPGQVEPSVPESQHFEGDSPWAFLQPQPPERLYEADETLYLSASHLKTWMTCPRQFYYRHLLKLSSGESPEAAMGLVIHKLFEVFNRQFGQAPYTAAGFQALADRMFDHLDDEEAFMAAGFDQRDFHRLGRLNPLARHDLRQRLTEAIAELEDKGYFRHYAQARAIHPEKELLSVSIPGIEGCQFKMTLDAVVQLPDGRWEIIDYKTYQSAYSSTSTDTCQTNFLKTLDPLPEESDLEHRARFRSRLNPDYPRDYQLPLYYLAAKTQPEYNAGLQGVAMQIVRPGFEDDPGQGAIRLTLEADALEAARARLTEDINRFLIEPIRSSSHFPAYPEASTCRFCDFSDICEGEPGEEEA